MEQVNDCNQNVPHNDVVHHSCDNSRAGGLSGQVIIFPMSDRHQTPSPVSKVRVLVLDCGNVTNAGCSVGHNAVAEKLNIDSTILKKAHKKAWGLARSDPSFRDYWAATLQFAGVSSEEITSECIEECEAILAKSLKTSLPDILETAKAAKEAGFLIGVVSNHLVDPPLFEYCAESSGLHSLVSHPSLLVVSQEVGLGKPNPGIYRLFFNRITKILPDVSPGELLFFDDKQANVDAAISEGWQAVVYNGTTAEQGTARRLLAERGVVLSS